MASVSVSESCNVCNSLRLEPLLELPALPLTGLYAAADSPIEPPTFDQTLLYCHACGHGQLKCLIDTSVLYDDTYTHRTSHSQIATQGNDFFFRTLQRITAGKLFRSVLEIGCNDLYLLRKMSELNVETLTGIDPIWLGKDHNLSLNVRVLGRFVEELKWGIDIEVRPDLIVSSHTFEHVHNLYEQLSLLVEHSADQCVFVIEVPSLETMVKTRRFDQVFHQHIQYTSLASAKCLIDRLGCTFLGHTYNYSYWGGTFLFWFQKGLKKDSFYPSAPFEPMSVNVIKGAYAEFRDTLLTARDQIISLEERVYGFGAAQMLPILAYHMNTDFGFMEAILDDNLDRAGKRLSSLHPLIRSPIPGELDDAVVVITALDSARPIMNRLLALNPRRILYPLLLL